MLYFNMDITENSIRRLVADYVKIQEDRLSKRSRDIRIPSTDARKTHMEK